MLCLLVTEVIIALGYPLDRTYNHAGEHFQRGLIKGEDPPSKRHLNGQPRYKAVQGKCGLLYFWAGEPITTTTATLFSIQIQTLWIPIVSLIPVTFQGTCRLSASDCSSQASSFMNWATQDLNVSRVRLHWWTATPYCINSSFSRCSDKNNLNENEFI